MKIRVLDPSIADKIAAGEVIERPSSVVKELVENALDANASEVHVRLEAGGKTRIEVIDNGDGMLPEDLELCFSRHATSKLKTVSDLESILTLGFRGEALPSIAAVSDINAISRAQGEETAFELTSDALSGRLTSRPKARSCVYGEFINASHGTHFEVRSLFSQIPARLKFLKSQAVEVSQIREWLERLAIAYPAVGFTLWSDDREVLNLRPTTEEKRIQAILSDGENLELVSASHEQDGFRDLGLQMRLHWLQGLSLSHTRRLIQIVNRRALKDRLLQQAILSAFKQHLLPGQFPALALLVEIHPSIIDVNVHPTKTEIRFLDSKKIFQSIDALVRSLIAQKGSFGVPKNFQTLSSFSQSSKIPSESFAPASGWTRASSSVSSKFPETQTSSFRFSTQVDDPVHNQATQNSPNPANPFLDSEPAFIEGAPHSKSSASSFSFVPQFQKSIPLKAYEPPVQISLSEHFLTGAQYKGSLFQTYLVFEKRGETLGSKDGEMILVDQHAADERIRYERLKKEPTSQSQALLIPEALKVPPESIDQALSQMELLGFEGERFGEDTLLIRSIPSGWGTHSLKARLKGLLDRVIEASSDLATDESRFEALASEACHSAIRAGDSLDPREISVLISDLFSCENPWNCPHGRPTLVKISRQKMEEWFLRKI